MAMLRLWFILFASILGLLDSLAKTEDSWRIAVDFSPFAGVEAAAQAEAQVDWRRGPIRQRNACTLSYAALELRDHLERVSHARFEFSRMDDDPAGQSFALATLQEARANPSLHRLIQEYALDSRLEGDDSYALVPHDEGLAIIGRERTGVLYGVYGYLESLGIRWYGPEPHEWVFPAPGPLRLPESLVVERPSFKTRGFWGSQGMEKPDFYTWMARNRFNYWTILEPNRAILHKLGVHLTYGGHRYFERYMDPGAPYPFDHPGFDGDEDLPIDPYGEASLEFAGDGDGDGRLTFFEARPEWYGRNESGEREPFDGYYGMNLCTANPAPLDYLYTRIVEEIAEGEWQDIDSLNFWAMDNGEWCHCGPCMDLGEPTDRVLLMVHGLEQAFDAAVRRGDLPRAPRIIFPIYQQTLPAPTRPLPEDFDFTNNIGNYFPIMRCYGHGIDDPTCTEYNVENWEALTGWTVGEDRPFDGEIFIGEYYNVSVNRSLPVLYTRSIQHDIPTYHRLGARHMLYMHTDTHLLGVKRINNFLYSRLLWDVGAGLQGEIDAYFNRLYGPASGAMRALYADLEFALSSIKPLRYWHHLPERIIEREFPLFDKKHFQLEQVTSKTDDGVDLAESVAAFCRIAAQLKAILARDDLSVGIRRRVADDEKTIRYGEHTVHFYDAVARALIAEHGGDLVQARAEFQRSLPHARALQQITDVTNTAISNAARAENGLVATRLEGAYAELAGRLGFPWPEESD
jgi:hypothetical protein